MTGVTTNVYSLYRLFSEKRRNVKPVCSSESPIAVSSLRLTFRYQSLSLYYLDLPVKAIHSSFLPGKLEWTTRLLI